MTKLETLQQKLKTISVDFNCGLNDEGLMRLNTRGALASLKETGATQGEMVILDDWDDLWVTARLVLLDDVMYGRFAWKDIEVKEARVGPEEVRVAFELVRTGKLSLTTPKDPPRGLGPFFLARLLADALDRIEEENANEVTEQHDAHLHTYRWSSVEPMVCDTCKRKNCPDRGRVEECGWEEMTEQSELKTIFCDFNVGPNHYGLLRLTTRSSVQSLKDTGAQVGEYVILANEGLQVEAMLVKQDGIMYGKFDWDDIQDVEER